MRSNFRILLVMGVLGFSLVAAGCGGSDDTSSDATATTQATTSDSSSADASSVKAAADDVFNSCIAAINGTPAQTTGRSECRQTRRAFEKCAREANQVGGGAGATALRICQRAADRIVKSLAASS